MKTAGTPRLPARRWQPGVVLAAFLALLLSGILGSDGATLTFAQPPD